MNNSVDIVGFGVNINYQTANIATLSIRTYSLFYSMILYCQQVLILKYKALGFIGYITLYFCVVGNINIYIDIIQDSCFSALATQLQNDHCFNEFATVQSA